MARERVARYSYSHPPVWQYPLQSISTGVHEPLRSTHSHQRSSRGPTRTGYHANHRCHCFMAANCSSADGPAVSFIPRPQQEAATRHYADLVSRARFHAVPRAQPRDAVSKTPASNTGADASTTAVRERGNEHGACIRVRAACSIRQAHNLQATAVAADYFHNLATFPLPVFRARDYRPVSAFSSIYHILWGRV